ncbi:MAG: hypothetical protein ACRDC4_06875, partial [Plesiomonas sp.]
MKISKSKQELARIISENGGWRGANYASQHGCHGGIGFSVTKPERLGDNGWDAGGSFIAKIEYKKPIKNWHQTILSREEYLHLHPAPCDKPKFCELVMRSIPEPETKPTIEQLAADYQQAVMLAEIKQHYADAAKADADAKLKALELAGEALELKISPITAKQEPELVITGWRDLQVGDEIECLDGTWCSSLTGKISTV